MERWTNLLREARRRSNVTQDDLARRAGVSKHTVSSYERGVRAPSQETLGRIVEALPLDQAEAGAILQAAGLTPLPPRRLTAMEKRSRPLDAIQRELDGYAWPSLVTNERYEIVAWNVAATKVAELDFAQVMPAPRDRNLMRITCMPHFSEGRVVNWVDVASFLIAHYKHNGANVEIPEEDSRYFQALVEDISTNFTPAFLRVMSLWQTVEPWQEGRRLTLYIEWKVDDGTVLRFNTVLGSWSDFDATWAFDWHPADATTWDWLGTPVAVTPSRDPAFQRTRRRTRRGTAAASTWNAMLALARRASGMTQRDLAEAAGLSRHTIPRYERGDLKPSREATLAMTRAMVLDTTTTNEILAGLGYDLEPSDWALLLCGLPGRTPSNWYSHSGAARRTIDDITEEIEGHTLPCIVLNDRCEIDAWNSAAGRVFGAELTAIGRDPGARTIVGFMARPSTRDHIANWEDVITAVVPAAARDHIAGSAETPTPERLNATISSIESEKFDVLARLRDLWSAAPAGPPALRVTFPVIWRHDDGAILVFNGIISEWSAYERRWSLDLHPADAVTWRWMRR